MSTVISTAAHEYFTRPADEKFPSLDALIAHGDQVKRTSGEVGYNLKDLRAVVTPDNGVLLESPKAQATLSHWSYGQLARMVGAPAGYLRTLPADIQRDALNFGIQKTPTGTNAQLLVQRTDDGARIRSITSESYGRLWDTDIHRATRDALGSAFELPPIWEGGKGGAYAGDRDSFLLMVDGGSIVNDPSAATDGRMYRGIMLRNSEVGASALVMILVLFQYICGNLNLWGAVVNRKYRRRHVGSNVLRDAVREIGRTAYEWTHRSAADDERLIKLLIDTELAHSREALIDELRSFGATIEQAEQAYATCESSGLFNASPRSYWGIAQGLTRNSQQTPYQDERFELDQLAAKILQAGAARVKV